MMRMKISRIVLGGLFALLLPFSTSGQSARQYFDELYKAGGLDRMADGYVCFDDSTALDTFFIFGKSETIKEFLEENGGMAKLPKAAQEDLNRPFLIVREYDKGVAEPAEEYLYQDGSDWLGDEFVVGKDKTPMRIGLGVAWETLRYKRAVEVLDPQGHLVSAYSRYGRCEEIPATVQQKAN